MQILRYGLVVLAITLLVPASWAQQNSFLRFAPGADEWQGSLQTSITRYENDQGQQVDLIAAIHIADASYYEALNDHFETLGEVLFELVTDEEDFARAPSGSNVSGVSILQSFAAQFLELQFQLDGIDYQQDNFTRADLSAQELAEIMATKNESFFSMLLKMARAQMAAEQSAIENQDVEPSALTMMSLISALGAESQAQALKYLLAQEMGRSGDLALSPELESQITILGDRNAVALQALSELLAQDEDSIGLFYGAAHMPGISRALIQELGFQQISRDWYTAWDIP